MRVTEEGLLAKTPHPAALGSALTNSWITTDFSEALLEFITPVRNNSAAALDFLAETHAVAAQCMPDEIIWGASMPCILPSDDQIPLAQYGSSNIAKMKTAYRRGLGHRYGRAMQTVAGIHYNFSMPDDYWQFELEQATLLSPRQQPSASKSAGTTDHINRRYLDLIRNFRRDYWLLIYLFGSAPCIDQSFVQGRPHNLQTLSKHDLYHPHATSLRMGDLGYQSVAQKSLFVCYNELENYIATLSAAINTPYAEYEKYGLEVNGKYQQLSCSMLQIENEFYSSIRPKRVIASGEKPLQALWSQGIQYIEVRCMDINPFMPLGIDQVTSNFLDAFLIACLISPSPQCDETEFKSIAENQSRIVNRGREPGLALISGQNEVPMLALAEEKLAIVAQVADILDAAHATRDYSTSVDAQIEKIRHSDRTPSAQVLERLAGDQSTFVEMILNQSNEFMRGHRSYPLNATTKATLLDSAEASLVKQAVLENNDTLEFKDFLQAYFAN